MGFVTPPAGFQVREMRAGDLGQVHAIETSSFTLPWTKGMFLNELEHEMGWTRVVLDVERRVSAFIVCRFLGDTWHVMDLAVQARVRRRGLGRFLLEEFFQATDGGGFDFFLEVRPSNGSAIALYRSLGFEVVGRRPRYYHDTNEDAFVMIRRTAMVTEADAP
jgi:ribosomal-protein-alanine N-acetyltransferase